MSPKRSRIAIIGGGVVGTSILYHLVDRYNYVDATLYERDQLGAASTSKAAGGCRYTFSSPLNIELGMRNLDFYKNFEKNVGKSLQFRENGYLYVFNSEEKRNQWENLNERYSNYGADSRFLTPAETAEIVPELETEEISGAFYAPECGHVDPYSVTTNFASAATESGGSIETGTAVSDVITKDGQVSAIEIDGNEHVEVDHVVNAAGPWAKQVNELVGLSTPVNLQVRHIIVTNPLSEDQYPLTIDQENMFYFETEQNGSLLICDMAQDNHDITTPADASGTVGLDYYQSALEKVSTLIKGIEEIEVINDWAGIQTHTPDGHAIVGETEISGFYTACGFSGHGVMQAPTTGAALADIIATGSTEEFDLEATSLGRFEWDNRIEPEQMP